VRAGDKDDRRKAKVTLSWKDWKEAKLEPISVTMPILFLKK
jgi:hypothetical protein